MEKQLENIEQLLAIFDQRDSQKNLCNRKIAEMLTPTVLSALVELLNLPDENVMWVDFNILDTVLVIRASVTYDPAHERSQFLTLISPPSPQDTPIQIQKMIQFGIPLTMVFTDKLHLKEWFVSVAQPDAPLMSQEQQAFDGSQLTKDQLVQLKYFQQIHGEKQ